MSVTDPDSSWRGSQRAMVAKSQENQARADWEFMKSEQQPQQAETSPLQGPGNQCTGTRTPAAAQSPSCRLYP